VDFSWLRHIPVRKPHKWGNFTPNLHNCPSSECLYTKHFDTGLHLCCHLVNTFPVHRFHQVSFGLVLFLPHNSLLLLPFLLLLLLLLMMIGMYRIDFFYFGSVFRKPRIRFGMSLVWFGSKNAVRLGYYLLLV